MSVPRTTGGSSWHKKLHKTNPLARSCRKWDNLFSHRILNLWAESSRSTIKLMFGSTRLWTRKKLWGMAVRTNPCGPTMRAISDAQQDKTQFLGSRSLFSRAYVGWILTQSLSTCRLIGRNWTWQFTITTCEASEWTTSSMSRSDRWVNWAAKKGNGPKFGQLLGHYLAGKRGQETRWSGNMSRLSTFPRAWEMSHTPFTLKYMQIRVIGRVTGFLKALE